MTDVLAREAGAASTLPDRSRGSANTPEVPTLLCEDYGQAVVHLVVFDGDRGESPALLVATIELLPHEVPGPPGESVVDAAPNSLPYRACSVVLDAMHGIDWYRAIAEGARSLPDQVTAALGLNSGAELVLGDLVDEPPWPSLVITRLPVPFSGTWHESARASHLLSPARWPLDLSADEQKPLRAWVKDRTGVDLGEFDELLGSVHLLAPNPVVRSFRTRAEWVDGELLAIHANVIPRSGRTPEGLRLRIIEQRPVGELLIADVALTELTTRVPLSHGIGAFREELIDAHRGLLHVQPSAVFIGPDSLQLHLSMGPARRRRVSAGDETYEVELDVPDMVDPPRQTGESARPEVEQRLRNAEARRQRRRARQHYFRGNRAGGKATLRELVNDARSDLLICDPYLRATEVATLLAALRNPQVHVRAMTSVDALNPKGCGRANAKESETEALRVAAYLAELGALRHANPVDFRVMKRPRGKSPIHDRFLVVDESVWLLGCSVNEFGERGSVLVELPNPDPVRADLEQVFERADPLLVERPSTNDEAP